jgi:hypothetical protein
MSPNRYSAKEEFGLARGGLARRVSWASIWPCSTPFAMDRLAEPTHTPFARRVAKSRQDGGGPSGAPACAGFASRWAPPVNFPRHWAKATAASRLARTLAPPICTATQRCRTKVPFSDPQLWSSNGASAQSASHPNRDWNSTDERESESLSSWPLDAARGVRPDFAAYPGADGPEPRKSQTLREVLGRFSIVPKS